MVYRKALIVDDSKLARVTLTKKLEAYGLAVLVVESAEQALDLMGDADIDIIFMDHLMPGMDGFEATQALRARGCLQPIIMCSGKDGDGYLEEALAIGANAVLSKPPIDEALTQVLATDFMQAQTTTLELDDFAIDLLDDIEQPLHDDALIYDDMDEIFAEEVVIASVPVSDDVTFEVDALQQQMNQLEVRLHALQLQLDTALFNVPVEDVAPVSTFDGEAQTQELQQQVNQLQTQLQAITSKLAEELVKEAAPELGFVQQELEFFVQASIDQSREVLLGEMTQQVQALQQQLDDMPIAGSSGQEDRELLVRMEEILHPRLIELKASLLDDVQQKIQADKESGFDELLELRLNVLLGERLAGLNQRLQDLEQAEPSEGAFVPTEAHLQQDEKAKNERYKMNERVTKHLDQLIEENTQFAQHIKQIRQLAIIAASAAGASLLLSVLGFIVF